jgi:hypothetical protein
MYEHRDESLLPRRLYLWRLARHGGLAIGILLASLLIGILGYRICEGLPWIDALVNAAMLLGGMGPANELRTTAGKLFASFYALYCGVVFLAAVGVLFAPVVHRFLHRFHLDAGATRAGARGQR